MNKKITISVTLIFFIIAGILTYFYNIHFSKKTPMEKLTQNLSRDMGGVGSIPVFNDSIYVLNISVVKGEPTLISIGIKNKKNNTLNYKINFEPISGPDSKNFPIDSPKWFQYGQDFKKLQASDIDIRVIRVNIPKNTNSGNYLLKVQIFDNDSIEPNNIYASGELRILVQ